MPSSTSPAATRPPSRNSDFSTPATQNPARSYSPGGYMSGISAVSPPTSAQPASSQPRAMPPTTARSEEHTSELQSLMRISYAVFCLKTKHTYMIVNMPIQKHHNE